MVENVVIRARVHNCTLDVTRSELVRFIGKEVEVLVEGHRLRAIVHEKRQGKYVYGRLKVTAPVLCIYNDREVTVTVKPLRSVVHELVEKYLDILLGGAKFRQTETPAGTVQSWFVEKLKLEEKEWLVKEILAILLEKIPGRVCINFSGGRDSLVLLHLFVMVCEEYGIPKSRLLVLHCDTGLHPPGTVDYVRDTVKELGLADHQLIVFRPIVSPWWIFRKFGFPGKRKMSQRYPYICCYLLKKLPTYLVLKYIPEIAIDAIGWTYHESWRRYIEIARWGIIQKLRTFRERLIVRVYPVYIFSHYDIRRYIEKHGLREHWIYKVQGCDRLACLPCTAVMANVWHCLRRINPKLYEFVLKKLNEYGWQTSSIAHEVKKFVEELLQRLDASNLEEARKKIARALYEKFGP